MEFHDTRSVAFSFEQACAVLRNSALVPSAMKASIAHVQSVPVPPGLSTSLAFTLYHQYGQASIAVESHPVAKLDKILAVADVKLTPSRIEAVVQSAVVTLELTRGYFVEDRTKPEPLMASVSDAMAYVYTSPSTRDVLSCPSNFVAGNSKAAIPVIKIGAAFNPDWQKGHGYANSLATYEKMTRNKMTTFQAHTQLLAMLKEAVPLKDYKVAVKAPPNYKGLAEMISGVQMVTISKPFIPSMQHIDKIDMAYKYLAAHRAARGEDNKWISPLTSGYYFGSMSRSTDRLLWKVADILTVLRVLQLSVVYFVTKPKATICQSLAANGIVVFTLTNGPSRDPFVTSDDGCVRPGVYRLANMDNLHLDYLVVADEMATSRPIYKTTHMTYPHSDEFQVYLSEMQIYKHPVMVTSFITPALLDRKDVCLWPSMHAHVGHVLALFNTTLAQPLANPQLIDRMATSNIFKTWFPLSRTRYFEYDMAYYKYHHIALQTLKLSIFTAKLAKSVMDFGAYDHEILAELSPLVDPQKFKFNSLWEATASFAGTPVSFEYQEYVPLPVRVPDAIDPAHIAPPSTATPPPQTAPIPDDFADEDFHITASDY